MVLGHRWAELVDPWWYWVRGRQYWLVLGGTESVWSGTGWHLVVLGQYNLVLLGVKWYWVSIGLSCLYILKNMEILSDVTIAGRQTRKERASQPLDHERLRWAINSFMVLLHKIMLEDDKASAVSWSMHLCFFMRGLYLDIPHIQLLHKVHQMNINPETFNLIVTYHIIHIWLGLKLWELYFRNIISALGLVMIFYDARISLNCILMKKCLNAWMFFCQVEIFQCLNVFSCETQSSVYSGRTNLSLGMPKGK